MQFSQDFPCDMTDADQARAVTITMAMPNSVADLSPQMKPVDVVEN